MKADAGRKCKNRGMICNMEVCESFRRVIREKNIEAKIHIWMIYSKYGELFNWESMKGKIKVIL